MKSLGLARTSIGDFDPQAVEESCFAYG